MPCQSIQFKKKLLDFFFHHHRCLGLTLNIMFVVISYCALLKYHFVNKTLELFSDFKISQCQNISVSHIQTHSGGREHIKMQPSQRRFQTLQTSVLFLWFRLEKPPRIWESSCSECLVLNGFLTQMPSQTCWITIFSSRAMSSPVQKHP